MNTKVTYLGGATYLLEIGSFRILTDPGFDPEGTEKSEGPGHNLKKTMSPPIPRGSGLQARRIRSPETIL